MDIELKSISKQFNHKSVLNQLTITFTEVHMNCLMGASGSGKTTVMNLVTGLLKPDSGEILGLQGKRISMVFQEDRLIEHWNAVKNIGLVCSKDITEERVVNELAKLGLSDDLEKPVREFSGGMKRRVAIIRALLAKSDIVLLDEPFRGMDLLLKRKVIEYIKQNTSGKTVIVITHEGEDVDLLEGRLITLE